AAREFREDRQGQVWLAPALAKALAETAPAWAREIGGAAEAVVKLLAARPCSRIGRLPTPISQDNRSAGREDQRRGPRRERSSRLAAMPAACVSCGVVLLAKGRGYCDECLPAQRSEQRGAFSTAGPAVLARLRDEGRDPR